MQYIHNGKTITLKIKSKLWIEVDGKPVFGRGRKCLLEAIDKYGSINKAATEMNMSYRKAWSYLNAMEERLGIKLIERQTGGKDGGGASLTENARKFLNKYEAFERGLQNVIDEKFKKTFKRNRL